MFGNTDIRKSAYISTSAFSGVNYNHVAKYFINKPISNTQKLLSENENGIIISVMATNDMEIIPIINHLPYFRTEQAH